MNVFVAIKTCFLATLGASLSAYVSTVFDVGGIVGGILAGIVSDYSGKSATTCAVMLIVAIPVVSLTSNTGSCLKSL